VCASRLSRVFAIVFLGLFFASAANAADAVITIKLEVEVDGVFFDPDVIVTVNDDGTIEVDTPGPDIVTGLQIPPCLIPDGMDPVEIDLGTLPDPVTAGVVVGGRIASELVGAVLVAEGENDIEAFLECPENWLNSMSLTSGGYPAALYSALSSSGTSQVAMAVSYKWLDDFGNAILPAVESALLAFKERYEAAQSQ